MQLDFTDAARVIDAALAEDSPGGDITSESVIPADLIFSGVMAARHDMVVAGLPVAEKVFSTVDPSTTFHAHVQDGDFIVSGTKIATVEGPARALLTAERVALNLLQMLSGIATETRRYVDVLEGTETILLDTRKTIPGLRRLSKYATHMGGAQNHRMSLSDAILIKDNHIAVCGGIIEAIVMAQNADKGPVEVECDTLAQVAQAVSAGADRILLDNMPPETLGTAVSMIGGRCATEASGGVTLASLPAIAETGVNFVSVGRITQSAPAVDIGLDWSAQSV